MSPFNSGIVFLVPPQTKLDSIDANEIEILEPQILQFSNSDLSQSNFMIELNERIKPTLDIVFAIDVLDSEFHDCASTDPQAETKMW